MTADAAMVLTGKKALDFSGGVSAEDERGIGGVERVMGPNGQAQYKVADISEAYTILFEIYRHTYCDPITGQVPRFQSNDVKNRDICLHPYTDKNHPHFTKIGDIFESTVNAERKKPFAIRHVMQALIDQDSPQLERFSNLHQGESAVIWSAHIGGISSTVIGIESQPILRRGRVPLDGPDTWTGGTLFPHSSKKIARAINAASGQTPVVVLANLSGFDGSPESLRRLQLEYGAEIGRAVVNCESPIIFVVIGRYHGGAYVVFSKALNPNITAMAVKGSFASVIGGAPAAAVVFPRKVRQLVATDERLATLESKISNARTSEKPLLLEERNKLHLEVTLEKRGVIAAEFDAIHSVERAIEVGSLDAIIEANTLRPAIIEALENRLQSQ
jgi:acetyl-CoA carboxylase carboxyltransferase component